MSAIGSVIVMAWWPSSPWFPVDLRRGQWARCARGGRSCLSGPAGLPAGLGDARQLALVRHGAEAHAAEAELAVHGPRPSASGAAGVDAPRKLRLAVRLDDQRRLPHCHPSLKGKPRRRSSERPSSSLVAVVTNVMSMPRARSTRSGSISRDLGCSLGPNVLLPRA